MHRLCSCLTRDRAHALKKLVFRAPVLTLSCRSYDEERPVGHGTAQQHDRRASVGGPGGRGERESVELLCFLKGECMPDVVHEPAIEIRVDPYARCPPAAAA